MAGKTDSDRLRNLARWFDTYERMHGFVARDKENHVQANLKRIAQSLQRMVAENTILYRRQDELLAENTRVKNERDDAKEVACRLYNGGPDKFVTEKEEAWLTADNAC